MKTIIPPKEHENALALIWSLTRTLESSCDDPCGSAIDRTMVEAAYTYLNRIGYTNARPMWEERAKAKVKAT